MAVYYHGIRVLEEETALTMPVNGTSALQVVFGTAPINLAANPVESVNVPKICNSFQDCVEYFGYSDDFEEYTLCQSMYANFKLFAVAPIVLVNVLDPSKHVKENTETQYTVAAGQVFIGIQGILLDTVKVLNGEEELTADVDYVASFDSNGDLLITLIAGGKGENATTLKVASKSIDPSLVTKEDVIGGYDALTGIETGIETVRQVYPRFGYTPGLLLAPGWSHIPEVGAVLASKSEELNGVFRNENLLDLDTKKAKKYMDCKQVKEDSGYQDKHSIVLWPMVEVDDRKFYYSAIYGALVAYMDATNDDVPNLYPSNKLLGITGAVLADGTEVVLDQTQANVLNGQGIVTALNDSGWKAWGNNTACYPGVTDPKDRWIGCRRFFSWWANSFILTFKEKVDDPTNKKLIESICDTENIRGNSYVSQGKCAGAKIEFTEEDNSTTALLDGKIKFRQHLAPYTPAEDISNVLAFDPDMLKNALS